MNFSKREFAHTLKTELPAFQKHCEVAKKLSQWICIIEYLQLEQKFNHSPQLLDKFVDTHRLSLPTEHLEHKPSLPTPTSFNGTEVALNKHKLSSTYDVSVHQPLNSPNQCQTPMDTAIFVEEYTTFYHTHFHNQKMSIPSKITTTMLNQISSGFISIDIFTPALNKILADLYKTTFNDFCQLIPLKKSSSSSSSSGNKLSRALSSMSINSTYSTASIFYFRGLATIINEIPKHQPLTKTKLQFARLLFKPKLFTPFKMYCKLLPAQKLVEFLEGYIELEKDGMGIKSRRYICVPLIRFCEYADTSGIDEISTTKQTRMHYYNFYLKHVQSQTTQFPSLIVERIEETINTDPIELSVFLDAMQFILERLFETFEAYITSIKIKNKGLGKLSSLVRSFIPRKSFSKSSVDTKNIGTVSQKMLFRDEMKDWRKDASYDADTFVKILITPRMYDAFKEFVMIELCVENIDFFEAYLGLEEMYHKEKGFEMDGSVPYAIWRFIYVVSSVQTDDQKYTAIKFDPEEIVTDSEHLEAFQLIFHTFIECGSIEELNLSDSVRTKITQMLSTEEEVRWTIYDAVIDDILISMYRNPFSRFVGKPLDF